MKLNRLLHKARRSGAPSWAATSPKALYIQRGATVEFANPQLRRRGLHRFNVSGTAKARVVLLAHAQAHNLMRMRGLNIAMDS